MAERLQRWGAEAVGARIWDRDPTVWFDEPRPELTNRLGWLDLPAAMESRQAELDRFGEEIAAEGFRHVIVLGMGGSSLAPEVYQATFGNLPDRPRLDVLDSTHPGAVISAAASVDLSKTLFLVSSKSGGTLETISFFRYFWQRLVELTRHPGRHFVAVTDPGSSLEDLATERGFRRIFLAPPDVGGRYSALTEFGLVPAAAIGADLEGMRRAAVAASTACGPAVSPEENPGMQLGAAMGELTLAGREKITFHTSDRLEALPAWIEQLIAESTGKDGRGIVPVGGEPSMSGYGSDRFFVVIDTVAEPRDELVASLRTEHPVAHVTIEDLPSLAGAMFVFEMAVALAGSVLEIHPFDQPDVQLAKDLAQRAMAGELAADGIDTVPADAADLRSSVTEWLRDTAPPDYVGVHAYLEPTAGVRAALQGARVAITAATGAATTVDFGPRFLHSTGQLHKGGPDTGRFLQLVDGARPAVPIPETDASFGSLITAQAIGDYQALRDRGRAVLRVAVGKNAMHDIDALADLIGAVTA